MTPARARDPNGFSLVEVMVAMMILTIGILGMAATTGFVFNQLKKSGQDTERSFAVQQVVEEVRAMPFANLTTGATATRSIGRYTVTWRVITDQTLQPYARRVRVITTGPGFASTQQWVMNVTDSTEVVVIRP